MTPCRRVHRYILVIHMYTHYEAFRRARWYSDSVLASGPKICGFKPVRGRWISKGDKNPRHDLLRGELKPSAPCRKILRQVNLTSMKEILRRQNLADISYPSFSCFAIFLLAIARELWCTNQELLEII
jgi:hypothetical protein